MFLKSSLGKRPKKPKNRWYFDFETYNIGNPDKPLEESNDVAVYAVGVYIELDKKYHDWIGKDALDKFIDLIERKGKEKKIHLIAHNCFFDYHFFLDRILVRWPEAVISAQFTDDDRQWLFAEIHNKELKIKLKFHDTWRWDQMMSLASWSEILATPFKKLKLTDYNKWNVRKIRGQLFYNTNTPLNYQEEREYLRNDVMLLPEIREKIEQFKEQIYSLPIMPKHSTNPDLTKAKFLSKITKSGIAKKAMERYIDVPLEEMYRQDVEMDVYEKMNRSYIGAFTSGNKELLEIKLKNPIIKSYDVNSLYPSIMVQGLPYGDLELLPPKDEEYVIWYEYEMSYCEWKKEYAFFTAPFLTKSQQNLADKLAKDGIHCTWYILKEYYDLMIKLCDTDIKIKQTYYQPFSHALDGFFEYLYLERLKAKEAGNDTLANSLKLVMNASYGKFGEKAHLKKWEWNNERKEYILTHEEKDDIQYYSLLTGLYVTTKGRLKLINTILAEIEQGNEFLYCDTDSIKLIEHKPPLFEINNTKLGAWKDEGSFNGYLHPDRLKRWYCYNDLEKEVKYKFASSGFNKQLIEDLTHEEKLKFFNPNINTLVKGGKIIRRLKNNWKTQLIHVDIYTLNSKAPTNCTLFKEERWKLIDNG